MHDPVHASRTGSATRQRWLRIGLLELWGMLVLAAVIGFLGPFGTYAGSPFVQRAVRWWQLLMGAYLLIRPAMALLGRFADHLSLPRRQMVFWGVVL